MKSFIDYLEPSAILLPDRVRNKFTELRIAHKNRQEIMILLSVLWLKDPETYDHSLRVGLLSSEIGRVMHLDQKALFYGGLMHDLGKILTDLHTLQKKFGWTLADTEEMKAHPVDSYRILRGKFDFTADTVLWHHQFQPNRYPETLPELLHPYSMGTKLVIQLHGRVITIADTFDALHRVNDKFDMTQGDKLGEEIKEKMIKFNPDLKPLIRDLYTEGVLTTKVYLGEPVAA